MRLDWWWQSMEPVLAAQEVFQRRTRFNVRDAQRYEADVVGRCSLDLSLHMTRPVGVVGDNDHHHFDILDGSDDRLAVVGPGQDVPRRDPAADSGRLKFMDNGVSQHPVRAGVADENVIGHPGVPSSVAPQTCRTQYAGGPPREDAAAIGLPAPANPARRTVRAKMSSTDPAWGGLS